jgi:hypothetical protein
MLNKNIAALLITFALFFDKNYQGLIGIDGRH